MHRLLLTCLSFLLLMSCSNELTHDQHHPTPTLTTVAVEAQPTILKSYYNIRNGDIDYREMRYSPRAQGGLDRLTLPGGVVRTYTMAKWLHLELNRPSLVTVVWDGSQPQSWLSSWRKVGTNRYQKLLPRGGNWLGAIGGTANRPYTVLFAEADGSAPRAPAVPSGLTRPVPNTPCPNWVHGRFTTTGPDGRTYGSWHPQIDPVYWCYFGHDHGADPKLMPSGKDVPFQYVAYYNNRQDEHNLGFKGFTFKDTKGNFWYINAHIGTEMVHRFGIQFHTVYIRVESPSGEVLANLGYKADFGNTRSNRAPHQVVGIPGQSGIRSAGKKQVRVVQNGAGFEGYETWTIANTNSGRGLGIQGIATFDTFNPMSGCNTLRCETAYIPSNLMISKGEMRGLQIFNNFGIDSRRALATGTFYTDPYGKVRVDGPSNNGAVRQYIKPGVVLYPFPNVDGSGATALTKDAWGGLYRIAYGPTTMHPATPFMDLEGGLKFN